MLNVNDAISIIESVAGFTDETTSVGEAWKTILALVDAERPSGLALSSSTRHVIKERYDYLVSKIIKHDSEEQELIPEAVSDYRNDIVILHNILSGEKVSLKS